MRSTRILKLPVQTALVALALCLLPGFGKAQSAYRGTFTLPFTAHWGTAVLPAGDYTIDMESATFPYLLNVRGGNETILVLASGADTKPLSERSQLTLVNSAGEHRITLLDAGQVGLALDYTVPKSEMEPMTSAKRAKTRGSVSELFVPVGAVSDSAAGL